MAFTHIILIFFQLQNLNGRNNVGYAFKCLTSELLSSNKAFIQTGKIQIKLTHMTTDHCSRPSAEVNNLCCQAC